MRRGMVVFVSSFGCALACGSFGEGDGAEPTLDAGASAEASVDAAIVDAPSGVEAAPSDGNPCSSRAARFGAGNFFKLDPGEGFDPQQMTIEAWIYVRPGAVAKAMHIVSHVASDDTAGWALALTPGPNLAFHSYTSGTENTLGGSAPAASVATGRWVHVAVTRNGSNVQLLVDGDKNAPFSNTFKLGLATAANISVGADARDGLTPFDGLIEEVRISNVVREIDIARKTMDADANTLALWRFDESGSDALDSSPNGRVLGEEGTVARVCMPRFADDDVAP